MKESYTYPVIIKKDGGYRIVTFPDFPEQMADAETEPEAIESAQEVLALCICDKEDMGIEPPIPSEPDQITLAENEKLIYVNLWIPYYRQVQKVVYVKKTLTLPRWLDEMAKAKNLDFAAILAKGIRAEPGINDRVNR